MAGITQKQAEDRLNEYMTAEQKVLLGQSYNIGGRTFTRADLGTIQEGIRIWNQRVKKLARKGLAVKFVTPS